MGPLAKQAGGKVCNLPRRAPPLVEAARFQARSPAEPAPSPAHSSSLSFGSYLCSVRGRLQRSRPAAPAPVRSAQPGPLETLRQRGFQARLPEAPVIRPPPESIQGDRASGGDRRELSDSSGVLR